MARLDDKDLPGTPRCPFCGHKGFTMVTEVPKGCHPGRVVTELKHWCDIAPDETGESPMLIFIQAGSKERVLELWEARVNISDFPPETPQKRIVSDS